MSGNSWHASANSSFRLRAQVSARPGNRVHSRLKDSRQGSAAGTPGRTPAAQFPAAQSQRGRSAPRPASAAAARPAAAPAKWQAAAARRHQRCVAAELNGVAQSLLAVKQDPPAFKRFALPPRLAENFWAFDAPRETPARLIAAQPRSQSPIRSLRQRQVVRAPG
jgi:hypothetical protein